MEHRGMPTAEFPVKRRLRYQAELFTGTKHKLPTPLLCTATRTSDETLKTIIYVETSFCMTWHMLEACLGAGITQH